MSEDERSSSQADGHKIIFPDLAELWKEMYFKTEGAWAEALKDFVSTETFIKMLDQTLNQHLSIEKITRQNMDRMFEYSATPSKKDLARIAELVISVEDKVDNLDFQLVENINKTTDTLLKMLSLMEKGQQEINAIKAQNEELDQQIKALSKQNLELKKRMAALKLPASSQSEPAPVEISPEETTNKAQNTRKRTKVKKTADEP
ncbi:Uncharacterized [Syntrophomonas zehnderi OL-4]|uniref:Uncharacterized n=1 Tax=Syntrophomonas zehnderi OL-4 TaxID=690567 RepID=A0A0E4C7N5_9FIRM|nr:hypothetical protein [Syntrophomonas zehnderi]CFX05575.1 Uncharacterized [Syntrophomonas zehnderi OL-4]CFX34547.1 Uncharacterized [Syntrophomonas zehnderi OL-4]